MSPEPLHDPQCAAVCIVMRSSSKHGRGWEECVTLHQCSKCDARREERRKRVLLDG